MEEITKQLASPAFWFFGVLLALLLNIASGYLKTWTDRCLERLSEKRRAKNKVKAENFESRIQQYKKDKHLQLVDIGIANGNLIFGFCMLFLIVGSCFLIYAGIRPILVNNEYSNTYRYGLFAIFITILFGCIALVFGLLDRYIDEFILIRLCVRRANQ